MPTQTFRDAVFPQESDEAFVYLVVIEHEDIDDPIMLCNAGGTWDETLKTYIFMVYDETYICAPFRVEPPGQSDEEPSGKLLIPNVDQRIGEAIESIISPATVSITAVLESDPTIIVGGPYESLMLQNVEGDDTMFEGELTWPQLASEPWPRDWIRPSKFLAAFRMLG